MGEKILKKSHKPKLASENIIEMLIFKQKFYNRFFILFLCSAFIQIYTHIQLHTTQLGKKNSFLRMRR